MTHVQTFAAALAAGLLLIGGAALPVPAPPSASPCALQITRSHGETRLVAVLQSPEKAQSGTYRLRVTQKGGLDLDQSGDFTTVRGQDMALSEITLGGRPETLTARLSVTLGGRTLACPLVQSPITL